VAKKVIFCSINVFLTRKTVFEGASTLSVDAKGRIAIPTRYRDALVEMAGGSLHITRHFQEDCLLLFPETEWVVFRERVAAWPMSASWQKRIVLSNAVALEMDAGSGRILLSPELREASRMGKDALLLGNGSHFELWDKQVYAAKEAQAREQPLPDALVDFVF
jgi:MraZ protein